MFQQMQAMAQKQVIIVTVLPWMSCCMLTQNRLFRLNTLNDWKIFYSASVYIVVDIHCYLAVCCARHSASSCLCMSVMNLTWAFYFVIPLSKSLFLLELLLIVSFHSFVFGRMYCRVACMCTVDLFLSGFSSIQFSLSLHGLCNTSSLFPWALFIITDPPTRRHTEPKSKPSNSAKHNKITIDTNSRHCMFSSYVPVTWTLAKTVS